MNWLTYCLVLLVILGHWSVAKICYKDRNRLDSKNIETQYLLSALQDNVFDITLELVFACWTNGFNYCFLLFSFLINASHIWTMNGRVLSIKGSVADFGNGRMNFLNFPDMLRIVFFVL